MTYPMVFWQPSHQGLPFTYRTALPQVGQWVFTSGLIIPPLTLSSSCSDSFSSPKARFKRSLQLTAYTSFLKGFGGHRALLKNYSTLSRLPARSLPSAVTSWVTSSQWQRGVGVGPWEANFEGKPTGCKQAS